MAKKKKKPPKTRKDLIKIANRSEKVLAIKECRRHTKIKFKHGATTIPRHNGDIPKGTMRSILKAFAMAGVAFALVFIFI